jgi:hypothetical protein
MSDVNGDNRVDLVLSDRNSRGAVALVAQNLAGSDVLVLSDGNSPFKVRGSGGLAFKLACSDLSTPPLTLPLQNVQLPGYTKTAFQVGRPAQLTTSPYEPPTT